MVQLKPMNETEYDVFIELSSEDHIRGRIKAGHWQPEEAAENMERMRSQILPQGLSTPDQYFFNVIDGTDRRVSGLWYMIAEQGGRKMLFVVDIQIFEQFRRHGFGTQAFHLMEDQAREIGITTIALNVFEHNHQTRAMYEKLGYAGDGESMSKEIDP